MSQSKRRSRKSKLVPRSTEGGEPEIEEVIISEDEEPPIKIMNTMSLAPQPGTSKSGSIQFQVDIEVEEWIDDELFIEENFNKMQSELSQALDKEITEEADWTNEEYGKFWAEAASDSEHEEKPMNEYEKLIKNQVDPSIIAGPLINKPGSSKDSLDLRPGTSKDNSRKVQSSKGSKKGNNKDEIQKGPSKGNKKDSNNKPDEMNNVCPIQPKKKETTPAPIPPPKPIRQYKRPGPKSKTMDKTEQSTEGKNPSDPAINEKTFKSSKNTELLDVPAEPKQNINISNSDEAPTTSHIDLTSNPDIDLPPATLEDQEKTMFNTQQLTDGPTNSKWMSISELDELAKIQTEKPVAEPEDIPLTVLEDQKKAMLVSLLSPEDQKTGRTANSDLELFAITYTRKRELNKNTMVDLRQIIVSEEAILSDSKLMAATSIDPIDKFLDIEVRNRMGNTRFVTMGMSREDALVDYGLRQWFKWTGKHKSKSTPLVYKCYICSTGWWHLHPFREHLRKHTVVNISLEKQNQDRNIIAHNGKSAFSVVPIQGECWRCGREYPYHLAKVFTCKGCQSTLFTCKALAEHEGICLNIWKDAMEKQKTKDIKAYKCKICPQIFFTEDLLHTHQYRSHVPRSDYPMWMPSSQCKLCHQNYVFSQFHYCSRRIQKFRCRYCSRHYPSITALQAHLDTTKSNVHCNVCKEEVLRECMMPRHLLVHSQNYVMVYKCLMCEGKNILLDDATMVTRHAEFVHKSNKYVRSLWCYAQIPLPVTLFALKKVTTRHYPTAMHDTLKELFYKDQLLYNPIELVKNTEESQDSSEEKVSEDSEPEDYQDYPEIPEAPKIKTENDMENCFEEQTEFDIKIVDTTSIKLEIDENVEGTEVNPADLIDITETEFLSVVKKEPDDDVEMHNTQSLHTSITNSKISKNTEDKEFSKQLQVYLSNRDEDDEEEQMKDNMNICLTCDFEGTKKEFKKHLRLCDSGEMAKKNQEMLICTKCNKEFPCMNKYVKHLPKHGFVWCKCFECNRVFTCLSSWTIHMKTHIRRSFTTVKLMANDTNVFRCRFCKEFVVRKLFFKHWEAHLKLPQKKKAMDASSSMEVGGGSLSQQVLNRIEEIFGMTKTGDVPSNCIICEKYFARLNEKKRHLVEHLLDAASEQMEANRGLLCQFCDFKVLKPDEYRRHMRDHASLTIYHCEICNKTFSDSSNFVKHKKVHDVSTAMCDVCKKKFLSKASLEAHIATHRSEPLHCALCPGKEFFSESAYNRHVRIHHDRVSSFRCQYCRERFPSLKIKWDHLWEKHQIRSQKADCPMCERKFRKTQDLKTHMCNDHQMKKVVSFVPIEETAAEKQ